MIEVDPTDMLSVPMMEPDVYEHNYECQSGNVTIDKFPKEGNYLIIFTKLQYDNEDKSVLPFDLIKRIEFNYAGALIDSVNTEQIKLFYKFFLFFF